MFQLFNRYSVSILAVTFLILFGSYAKTDEGYLFCVGNAPGTTRKYALHLMKEKRSDLVQKGTGKITWCGVGKLPALNDGERMILPTIEAGKSSIVFSTAKKESLEISRWTKKDVFEGIYQSTDTIVNMNCRISTSIPQDLCDSN